MYAFVASMALMATSVAAQSVGEAIVVNMCNYDVYVANTPAQGGGYESVDLTLSTGENYTQSWTELSNGYGWALKLNKDNTDWTNNILQYEYTFHNDGIIWFDLSAVNGNPWNTNWEVSASNSDNTCKPRQAAYRYATDDAYGMQDCSQDSTVTVTLCSGEEQNDGAAASVSSSMAAATSGMASATSVASPASSTEMAEATSTTAYEWSETTSTAASSTEYVAPPPSSEAAVSTTLATRVSTSAVLTTDPAGVTVTEVATAVVTEVATVTHWWHRPHDNYNGPPSKRHKHNA